MNMPFLVSSGPKNGAITAKGFKEHKKNLRQF